MIGAGPEESFHVDVVAPRIAGPAGRLAALFASHTIRYVLDNGFWCATILYPTTECTPARAVGILEMVGTDRIMAN